MAANVGWMSPISTPGNRRRMRIIVAIAFFSQWSGNGLASYYLNQILTDIDIKDPNTQASSYIHYILGISADPHLLFSSWSTDSSKFGTWHGHYSLQVSSTSSVDACCSYFPQWACLSFSVPKRYVSLCTPRWELKQPLMPWLLSFSCSMQLTSKQSLYQGPWHYEFSLAT